MEKEDLGPFPLQWKALEALNWFSLLTRKDEMWMKEIQAYSHKRGVNSLWNAAYNVCCQRMSPQQSQQHNNTKNSLRKWWSFMAFYSQALGYCVASFECEKGLFRAQLGLWPAHHEDWARIWCQIDLGADPLVVGRPTNFNKCVV